MGRMMSWQMMRPPINFQTLLSNPRILSSWSFSSGISSLTDFMASINSLRLTPSFFISFISCLISPMVLLILAVSEVFTAKEDLISESSLRIALVCVFVVSSVVMSIISVQLYHTPTPNNWKNLVPLKIIGVTAEPGM